ncbi:MAG: HAD family hydrolase [Syntrophobacteraceae bacterium]
MIEIKIPGFGPLRIFHLVLDYNGTLACDGKLIYGVEERLKMLSGLLEVHVLTADTFGSVEQELAQVPCKVFVIPKENQAQAKAGYLSKLGPASSVAIGNGRNDRIMLKEAALGIATVQTEGASLEAILAAKIVSTNIVDALDLLIHPLRLTATLRS